MLLLIFDSNGKNVPFDSYMYIYGYDYNLNNSSYTYMQLLWIMNILMEIYSKV